MSRMRAEVRRHVLFSYLEKVAVVLVIVGAFSGLSALGRLTDEKKLVIDGTLLSNLADAAGLIAHDPNKVGVAKPLKDIADNFKSPGKPERLSPAELTGHIEHLADATIWNDYRTSVEALQNDLKDSNSNAAKPELKTKKPNGAAEPNSRLTDLLAAQDARARGRIAAAHALIEAAVIHIQPQETSVWKKMSDEKSALHVLYEVIWYALLIVGVLACSYLLMIAFTALPFTSISGEWTKRLEEILKGALPGGIRAVAIAPLAVAALVAGTVLTGTTYATVPGGISREYTQKEQTIEKHSTVNEGDTTFDYRSYPQSPPIVPPGLTETQLESHLQSHTTHINDITAQHAHSVADRVIEAEAVVDRVGESVRNVEEKTEGVGILATRADQSAGRAEFHAGAAHDAAKTTGAKIDAKSVAIAAEQERQKDLQSHSLANNASVDDRGFWGRSFGFTQFKVRAAVIDAMEERMSAEKLEDARRKDVRKVLAAMADEEPLNRWKFESALKDHGMSKAMIDRYVRTLLHLSALPRE